MSHGPKSGHRATSANYDAVALYALIRDRELLGPKRALCASTRAHHAFRPPSAWTSHKEGAAVVSLRGHRALHPRGLKELHRRSIASHLHTHAAFVRSLSLDRTLQAHSGCVNRLRWSDDGVHLASVSDDLSIVVWNYHDLEREPTVIPTKHRANIFGVRFLPTYGPRVMITGAMDSKVQLHHVGSSVQTITYSCHEDRVKDVEVDPSSSHIFWSAGEDGFIRQFDLRSKHKCNGEQSCGCTDNVLVDARTPFVTHAQSPNDVAPEFKSVHVNPVDVNFLVAACRDQYVRIYDRRMLTVGGGHPSKPCAKYCPRHFKSTPRPKADYTTYACFSPDGSQILANYTAEQIYLFDVSRPDGDQTSFQAPPIRECTLFALDMKAKGNSAYVKKQFSDAIAYYTSAINVLPQESIFYSNRSTALIHRKWTGDISCALDDAETAIQLDAKNIKAHLRKVSALKSLSQYEEALKHIQHCLDTFEEPPSEFMDLQKQIETAIFTKRARTSTDPSLFPEYDPAPIIDSHRMRFSGRINERTDIKEACFFGRKGDYIVAGSDDGCVYAWERQTGALVNVFAASSDIINCVQGHPFDPLLAVSGIEDVVKIYSPHATGEEQGAFPEQTGRVQQRCVLS